MASSKLKRAAEAAPSDQPWLVLLLAVAAAVLYLASELYVFGGLALPLDDSWIHLQFARQMATGGGLAYNDGEWIPGSTAPLWTALLALGFVVPGAALAWAKALGVAFYLGTVHATDRLAAELALSDGLRRLAGVLTAATPWLVWSALSGMEVCLFTFLSLWGIVLHLRERRSPSRTPASLALFAVAVLARPEGLLLLLLALIDRGLRFAVSPADTPLVLTGSSTSRSAWTTGLLASAIVLLPTWIFFQLTGGSILPTTFAVKSSPTIDWLPSSRYLKVVIDIVFGAQPIMLLLAGAGALRLIERLGTRRDHGLLPALWPIGLALTYSLLAAPQGPIVVGNFGRYYFPILPVVVVLGVLGLQEAGRRLGPAVVAAGRHLPLRAVLVIALIAPQLVALAGGVPRYLQTLANVEDSDVKAARWLAERLPPEALLAVQDIGAIKYHLPNPVVDLAGIINPDILPFLHGSGPQDPVYWEERLLRYLSERKPDYLVVFPQSYPQLTSARYGFRKIQGFPVRHNVTMAGDELAIFATPWTRYPLAAAPDRAAPEAGVPATETPTSG